MTCRVNRIADLRLKSADWRKGAKAEGTEKVPGAEWVKTVNGRKFGETEFGVINHKDAKNSER
jgi:hypothetical protein